MRATAALVSQMAILFSSAGPVELLAFGLLALVVQYAP
jgi:hypothetical protein